MLKTLRASIAFILVFAALEAAAYTYNASLKDARQGAIATAIDGGGTAGKLEIGTTGMGSVLCTFTLNYSPSGIVSGGVLTLSGFPKVTTCTAAGTAAAARIRTSANTDVVTGLTVTVTGGGGNITITDVTLDVNQSVTLDHITFTHP